MRTRALLAAVVLMVLTPAATEAQVALSADTPMQYCAGTTAVWAGGTTVTLDGSGLVRAGVLAQDASFQYCPGTSVRFQAGGQVTFRTNPPERCLVAAGTLAADTSLRHNASSSTLFRAGTAIAFQPGPRDIICRVISGTLAADTALFTTQNAGAPTPFKAGTWVRFNTDGLVAASTPPAGGGGGRGGGAGGGTGAGGIDTKVGGVDTKVGGTDTRVAGTTSGQWRLVARRMDKSSTQRDCYPFETTGGEGRLTHVIRSTCGENGRVSVDVRWTPPPDVLVPGQPLTFDVTLTPTVSNTSRGLDVPVTVDFEKSDLACGYSTGGPKLFEPFGAGVGKPGGRRSGEAPVPAFGAFDSRTTRRIDLRVCSRDWGQRYTYEWSAGGPGGSTGGPSGEPGVIVEVGNDQQVYEGPTSPTVFTIDRPHTITLIKTYHWNRQRGTPEAGTLALRGADGRTYGPWQATGRPGMEMTPNANWIVQPGVTIPAGTYTVVDSDPTSWSQNEFSKGREFARVEGVPAAK